MNTVAWEHIKEFYEDKFGIEGWVVEMYANMDILSLCASGASNKTIESFLEIPEGEIVRVIRDAFEIEGWETDLPINPYKMFCSYDGEVSSLAHLTDFILEVAIEMSKYKLKVIDPAKLFYICEAMYDIERKIADEWI